MVVSSKYLLALPLVRCCCSAAILKLVLVLFVSVSRHSVIFRTICLFKHQKVGESPSAVFKNESNYINSIFMLTNGWISFSFMWINSLSPHCFYAGSYSNRIFKSCNEKFECFQKRLGLNMHFF